VARGTTQRGSGLANRGDSPSPAALRCFSPHWPCPSPSFTSPFSAYQDHGSFVQSHHLSQIFSSVNLPSETFLPTLSHCQRLLPLQNSLLPLFNNGRSVYKSGDLVPPQNLPLVLGDSCLSSPRVLNESKVPPTSSDRGQRSRSSLLTFKTPSQNSYLLCL
jgi:hypothetical protein